MNSYGYWQKYGNLLAINLVVAGIVVLLMLRGAWALSGAALLVLLMTDMLVANRIRKSEASGRVHAGGRGRFFLFYGYALAVGGLIWLVLRIKEGIRWVDLAPFLVLVLLGIAMLSLGKRMALGANQAGRGRRR